MVSVQCINHLLMQGGRAKGLPVVRLCVALWGVITEVHMGCRQHDSKMDAAGLLPQLVVCTMYVLWLLGISLVAEESIAEAHMHGRPESLFECKVGTTVRLCWQRGWQACSSLSSACHHEFETLQLFWLSQLLLHLSKPGAAV